MTFKITSLSIQHNFGNIGNQTEEYLEEMKFKTDYFHEIYKNKPANAQYLSMFDPSNIQCCSNVQENRKRNYRTTAISSVILRIYDIMSMSMIMITITSCHSITLFCNKPKISVSVYYTGISVYYHQWL